MKLTKILETAINTKLDLAEATAKDTIDPAVRTYYKGTNPDIINIINHMLDANLRSEVYVKMVEKLKSLPKDKIKKISKELRTYSLQQFLKTGWKTFEDFFTVKIERFGAGELMCVMGIKNSRSGGLGEKDLTIDGTNGGYYEVKEGPDTIQMAGSGASGKFPYVRKMIAFYELLGEINLRDRTNDKVLRTQLGQLFKTEKVADEIFNALILNFRGDSDKAEGNYFEKFEALNELPGGMIQKHLEGFRILSRAKTEILGNKDIMAKSKLQISTPKFDDSYYITTADAEKIKKADNDTDVKIHKGMPITKETKTLASVLITILKFDYVTNPLNLVRDIAIVKDNYFKDIDGLVWFGKASGGSAQPFVGYNKDFVIQGISLNMGKMRRAEKATFEFEKLQNNF